MSDVITWGQCPHCWDVAAFGWTDGRPVELDCVRGCAVPQERIADLLEIAAPS